MSDRFGIKDIQEALKKKQFPTTTLWNRLEGRPRTVNFERALRAEVRDALWMITRQWQVGEFRGEDAGSPVFAKMHVATTRFTRFKPGEYAPQDFIENVPLETQVEQRPLSLTVGPDKISLDLRLIFGRRWLKLISGIGDYAGLFIAKYKIDQPDPTKREDAAICAHPEVWQVFAATAERALDGVALYQYLAGGSDRHPYDGITVLDEHKLALDEAATKFKQWAKRLISHPAETENPAWIAPRLEYRFACSAPVSAGEKVYAAEEYYNGTLDWHSVDVNPEPEGMAPEGPAADPREVITRTMIPVPLTYPGMPHPRWWTIEDSCTNFGEIRPDTTDLAKLLFIEFGLVYSNDWFMVPFTLPGGTITMLRGLAVTNVFGERFWIEAAGRGTDDDWQRWSLFTVSVLGTDKSLADNSLLMLPTVPKVQESSPLEEVLFIRDEMANMVWAIEKTIPAPDGFGKSGAVAARETRRYFEQLVSSGGASPPIPLLENEAKIRYDVMSEVPEHWIPFIAVRAKGSLRAIELQRAVMPRLIQGDPLPPNRVRPRTTLLRVGLDQPNPAAYLVPEEEVPRAGIRVTQSYQRTRWLDGGVFVWLGVRKQVGRGEGSSGLAFDRILEKTEN